MMRGSQGLQVAATGLAIVWLVSVATATGRPDVPADVSRAFSDQLSGKAGWEPLAAACGVSPAGFAAAVGQAAPGEQAPMAEEVFENVQVLQGIPVDEFMGTMGLFSAGLGLCCLQCHSSESWAADTLRKRMARRMVTMMNGINEANFFGREEVTCWTCHRSDTTPQETPIVDIVYGEVPFYPEDILRQQPGQTSPGQIFDRYIEAVGGADRLAELTSFVAKGQSIGYGAVPAHPVEVFAKAPNQRTVIVHTPDGDTTVTYDGRMGWQATFLTFVPVMSLTGGELEGAKLDAQLLFPGQIQETLIDWRVHFPTAIGEGLFQVVQGSGPGGFFATLYFDDETGLLSRVVRYAPSVIGRVPTQIDFADYRDVSGIKMPFKWTVAWLTGRDTIELNEVQLNVPIDAARFAKPGPAVQQ